MTPAATSSPGSPLIIETGGKGGIGIGGAVLGVAALVGAVLVGKHFLDQRNKNQGEEELDTPAGQIALELKTVFDSFPVSDSDYRKVALKITPALKDDVYRIYRKISLRNLSDDIAKHIGAGTQSTTTNQEKINSTAGTLITISPDDRIQFNIQRGGVVRFEPGRKTPIPLFLKPTDVFSYLNAAAKPYFMLQPTAKQFLVTEVKEVPFDSVKLTEGWTILWKPFTRTRKVYAMVQLSLPVKDSKGNKSYVKLWGDAREFRLGKGANYLKGLGCDCQRHIGLAV